MPGPRGVGLHPLAPVFCPMLCRSRGYLVSRCISVGIISFSCRRRHRGRLSASCGQSGAEVARTGARFGDQPPPWPPLTCTKAQNRGSLRCLTLSCSKANDWRLQKREEIFWNHLPSAPSNYSEIQAREGVSGGIGKNRVSHGNSSLDRRTG